MAPDVGISLPQWPRTESICSLLSSVSPIFATAPGSPVIACFRVKDESIKRHNGENYRDPLALSLTGSALRIIVHLPRPELVGGKSSRQQQSPQVNPTLSGHGSRSGPTLSHQSERAVYPFRA